jgi:short-subunit dehydrogenase
MSKMPGFMWLQADRVASEALDCCERGKIYCVPGLVYKTLLIILWMIPAPLRRWLVARQSSSYRDSSETPVKTN